jgi:hypothetical protein
MLVVDDEGTLVRTEKAMRQRLGYSVAPGADRLEGPVIFLITKANPKRE